MLQEKPKEGIPRQLFVLTDGEVDNTEECIATVRRNAHTTRVFTFGIGTDASQQLVEGLAKAGEGKFEIIKNNDTMEEQVMRQLNRALKPAFTDVKIFPFLFLVIVTQILAESELGNRWNSSITIPHASSF